MGHFNWVFTSLVAIAVGQATVVFANPSMQVSSNWAIQSLTDLMAQYPCAGRSAEVIHLRPQPINRYEVAALLSSCLVQWGDRPLDPQALSTIKTLNAEFKLELAVLRSDQSPALLSRLVVLGSKPLHPEQLFHRPELQTWAAGVGIRDFMIPKSLLTFTAGQDVTVTHLQQPTQMNYRAFYQFPIGNRLMLGPSVVIMTNPNHSSGNPTVEGALQASFSF